MREPPTFRWVRLVRPSLWSAISRVSVLNRWVSGPSLRSPFSNFRFGVPQTGSICGRDWFADPHCGRRWPLGDRYALNSPSLDPVGETLTAWATKVPELEHIPEEPARRSSQKAFWERLRAALSFMVRIF